MASLFVTRRATVWQRTISALALIVLAMGCALADSASADDWPRWLGANADSRWNEEGIAERLPAGELPKKWSAECSWGYAAPVVADGKVLVFDYEITEGEVSNGPSRPVDLNGKERLLAFDAASGKPLWNEGSEVAYHVSYPGGPRAAPTVDGEYVYTLGTMGDLTCRHMSNGTEVWHVNFKERFDVDTPIWGHSSAPWVEGNHVICNVGGPECGVVAFDKLTGETKWKALSLTEPGYCAPVGIDNHGERQVVAFHPRGATAFDPASGAQKWSVEVIPNFGMASSPPRHQDGKLFVSAYGSSAMVDLLSATSAKVVWRGNQRTSVYTSNAPSVFDDDAIYGFDAESSQLIAVDPASGDRLWETPKPLIDPTEERLPRNLRHGTGFLVKHTPSGTYYIFTERGELIHARLTREGYQELGRAAVVAPTNEAFRRDVVWVHPAFANGGMVVRNDKEVVFVGLGE